MFVFAVAVVVGEDILGGVRLVASDAEGDTDIAVVSANEAVDGAQLGRVVG